MLGLFWKHYNLYNIKGVKKVRSTIKIVFFYFQWYKWQCQLSNWTYPKRNTQLSFTSTCTTLQRKKIDLQNLVPHLNLGCHRAKWGYPHIQSSPCNSLFDPNFLNWQRNPKWTCCSFYMILWNIYWITRLLPKCRICHKYFENNEYFRTSERPYTKKI